MVEDARLYIEKYATENYVPDHAHNSNRLEWDQTISKLYHISMKNQPHS